MKVHVLISGRVQGVFFRAWTREKAEELGLAGWVKNLDDGRVEAFFAGSKEKVEGMIKWCWKGPVGAKVERIDIIKKTMDNEKKYKSFEIL